MIFLDFPAKSAVFWRGRTYKHSCRWARDTGQRHATKSGYEHTDRQGAKKKSQKVHKWLGSWMISPNPWISMRYVEVIAIITYNPLPCNILSFNRTSKQSEKWSTWQHGNKPTLKKQMFCLFHTPPDWHYCYMDYWPSFVQAHHPFAEVVSVRQCETVGWSFENSPRQKTVKRCEKHQVVCISFWHQWCIKPCQYWDLNYQPQLVIAAFRRSTVCKACFLLVILLACSFLGGRTTVERVLRWEPSRSLANVMNTSW